MFLKKTSKYTPMAHTGVCDNRFPIVTDPVGAYNN